MDEGAILRRGAVPREVPSGQRDRLLGSVAAVDAEPELRGDRAASAGAAAELEEGLVFEARLPRRRAEPLGDGDARRPLHEARPVDGGVESVPRKAVTEATTTVTGGSP